MFRKFTVAGLFLLFCLATGVLAAADDDSVKGMITNRTGETLTVKTDQGEVTVLLTAVTETKDNRGLIGVREKDMGDVVLIPGLRVDIDGAKDDQGRFVAKKINVDGDDLETSEMIEAGLNPTAEQVEAHSKQLESQGQAIESNEQRIAKIEALLKQAKENQDRFERADNFDEKGEATIKFSSGSSTIASADQRQLKQLADNANKLPEYLIKVTGFADSSGDAAMNTELSEDRAKAVVAYLTQQAGVPVQRVVAPGAMGEYGSTVSNESSTGRAQNRRVEVKVLYPKQRQ